MRTCGRCGWRVGAGHDERCTGKRGMTPTVRTRHDAPFLKKYGA